jgi:TonB family protein
MSAGFGGGVATGVHRSAGVAQQSGFDVHRSEAKPHQASSESDAPVEITFKPKPDYTDEGRRLGITGEVCLEVLFGADGSVHVIRVLQGLGYGLDEQAVKAAEQIRFKPASRVGQPVDAIAQVRIIFRLIS